MGFCAFEFGKLSPHQNEAVTIGNNQETNSEKDDECERGGAVNSLPCRGAGAQLIKIELVLFEVRKHLANVDHHRLARSD